MNWKYSLAIHGTVEQIKEFTKELDKIGYEENAFPYNLHEGDTLLTKRKVACQLTEGYDYFSDKEFLGNNADYHFNLPEDKEVALAIAAMKDTSEVEYNEICVGTTTGTLYRRIDLHNFEVLKGRFTLKDTSPGTIKHFNYPEVRKATAQEIIEYFKRKPMKKREIIGYKAPYNLFGGGVEAGEIYIPNDRKSAYFNKYGHFSLPKEIVEEWEPVYKINEETVEINGYTFKISKDGIYFVDEGKWIYSESLEMLLGNPNILTKSFLEDQWSCGYVVSYNSFTIGCTSGFKREDIERVLSIYDKLNKE